MIFMTVQQYKQNNYTIFLTVLIYTFEKQKDFEEYHKCMMNKDNHEYQALM